MNRDMHRESASEGSRRQDGDGTVAVVGAGIAGLTCARWLARAGVPVRVVDRGRGPAGRATTRRVELDGGRTVRFDHGAQYFTVRAPRFREAVDGWIEAGVAAPWAGRIGSIPPEPGRVDGRTGRWVGLPGMSAPGRHLVRGLDVEWGVRVEALRPSRARAGDGGPAWTLADVAGRERGPFRAVVLATPAPQASPLLDGAAERAGDGALRELTDVAAGHGTRPCWAARNSSKPGRAVRPETWVLHAAPEWSARRLDAPPVEVARELLDAFFRAAGIAARDPLHLAGHRWRYARSAEPREDGALAAADAGILVAGDWLAGDRVEGAWVSGAAAAERLLADGSGPGLPI